MSTTGLIEDLTQWRRDLHRRAEVGATGVQFYVELVRSVLGTGGTP